MKFRDEENILHAVEVDRSQKMKVNEEKLKKYEEFPKIFKEKYNWKMPGIHFFVVTKYREKKLEELAAKYDVFVKVYIIEKYKKVLTSLQTNLLTLIRIRHKISLICHSIKQ
ncbi:hypothetical protein ACVCK3_03425 [Bacillus cereus]